MKNHDDEEEEEEEEENQVVCLPPCALKNFEEVLLEADNKEVLVFLDYDGTLSPIVTDPNKAYISEETRKAVLEVSTRFRTSIISGRSVDKVKNFVGLPHLFYAGSHGMDIEGPDVGICGQTTAGTTNRVKHRPEGLDQNEAAGARDELSERTAGIEGVTVEDNKFCCSVHFRNCKDPTSVDRVERIVREVSDERGLDVKRGRKVFEVRPRVTWNKGNALDYLMSVFEVTQKTGFPIYLGDDKTDEDAFAKLRELGCGRGVLVSTKVKPTQAHYSVKDPTEVLEFLRLLSRWGKSRDEPEGR
mmetsp:Transcript_3932/g.13824  ORF Transcript_3932/g.13824 Transcript_3932/m.13824 type:complete len:302 (+) Transcript_3932:218-1123(+)|eukprot:CAMPEP_0197503848 /NCGR_PEP_ID=MMETSP1312-20131121/3009_1 /TAXON_ID=464262 /ORGANISM="Genus nov. species nov., Strain RCC2335" /LENGTH=301 /DNA_ID=CAMNT_0043050601 /DNA_START=166 /DNA_END=1071 /DNA_ORIENTATION=+